MTRSAVDLPPSPGTPDWEGVWKIYRELIEDPHPDPPPEYRERE